MFALCTVLLRVYEELLTTTCNYGYHNFEITCIESSRCVWTPAFRILGGHFDLGSIAFIYLFLLFYCFFFLRKLDLLRLSTESGIEFQ